VKNVNNLWDGGSVSFNIKNILNQKVITDYDIGYTVTCTIEGEAAAYSACHMNGTTSNTQDGVLPSLKACINNTNDGIPVSTYNQTQCEAGGYDWADQVSIKDLYFDVVLTNTNYVISDVVVNVTATSNSPYHKTLSGTFTLHKSNAGENAVTMSYKTYSNYDRLIISNSYSSTKCVRVTWDTNEFLINEDNSLFSTYLTDSNGYINEIKFNINAKNSISYMFYKRNFDMTYNVSDFLIEETTGC
jgi:hypothetical protein